MQALLALSLGLAGHLAAGSLVDNSFNVGTGPNRGDAAATLGSVRAMVVEADQRIWVAGKFSSFNGAKYDGLVRLNPDGSVDRSLVAGLGTNNEVYALLREPSGTVLVGGRLGPLPGQPHPSLVRINSDGTLDESFKAGLDDMFFATALLRQPDQKILVAGVGGLVRLLPDGQVDPTFNTVDPLPFAGSLVLRPEGRVLFAGPPPLFGSPSNRRLFGQLNSDGSLDPTFLDRDFGIRTDGPDSVKGFRVSSILPTPDGRILLGGSFTLVTDDGYREQGVIRLLADGQLDPSYRLEASRDVQLFGRPDGRVLLAGIQITVDGLARSGVAQILPGEVLDLSFFAQFAFEAPVSPGFFQVTAVALQSDGKVVAAGLFNKVDGFKHTGIVRLFDSVATDLNVVAVSNPAGGAKLIEANTNVVLEVTRAGTLDRSITVGYHTVPGSATAGDDFQAVQGMLVFAPGEYRKSVVIPILDGSTPETNETFSLQLSLNGAAGVALDGTGTEEVTITDDDGFHFWADEYVVRESGGEIEVVIWPGEDEVAYTVDCETEDDSAKAGRDYVATHIRVQFSSWWQDAGRRALQIPILDNPIVDGDRSFRLTLRNPTSGLPLGPRSSVRITVRDDDTLAGPAKGLNGTIHAAVARPDGRILIGGWFTSMDGQRRRYVAQLTAEGAVDPGFDPGTGPDGPVTAVAVQSDGRVVIGGLFATVSGTRRAHVARLLADGSLDLSFDPGDGWQGPSFLYDEMPSIRTLLVQPDGKILAGGSFTSFNGVARPGVARLNSDGSLDDSFDPQLEDARFVDSMALQSDGKVLVGGYLPRSYLNHVFRLNQDGSQDETFHPFPVARARALVSLPGGQTLVGDQTSTSNGPGVHRLNADGTRDGSFLGKAYFSEIIHSLVALPDGSVLAAGLFSDFNSDRDFYSGLVRYTATGVFDPTFPLSTRDRWRILVRTMLVQEGGDLFLGGTFNGMDDEEAAVARRDPVFGFAWVRRGTDPYHWLRLDPEGRRINDLRFEQLVRSDDETIHLSVGGQGPGAFTWQVSENLRDWSVLGTNATPNTGLVWRDLNTNHANSRFYRIGLP